MKEFRAFETETLGKEVREIKATVRKLEAASSPEKVWVAIKHKVERLFSPKMREIAKEEAKAATEAGLAPLARKLDVTATVAGRAQRRVGARPGVGGAHQHRLADDGQAAVSASRTTRRASARTTRVGVENTRLDIRENTRAIATVVPRRPQVAPRGRLGGEPREVRPHDRADREHPPEPRRPARDDRGAARAAAEPQTRAASSPTSSRGRKRAAEAQRHARQSARFIRVICVISSVKSPSAHTLPSPAGAPSLSSRTSSSARRSPRRSAAAAAAARRPRARWRRASRRTARRGRRGRRAGRGACRA